MIRANASRYPISAQCRILGVPRSTYYWMIEHPEAERVDPIAGDVHAIWRDSHERYGARKIKAALERRGVTASRRRIVNIMKRRGMTSAYARRTFKPHKTRVNEARLANILDREFDGYEPRTHLASDLTYVRVGGKWAYVCLLIDLANRSIAGHSADTSRTADLVMAAFATLDFPLTEVEVFHTDRGSEFDNAKIDELDWLQCIGQSDEAIRGFKLNMLLYELLSLLYSRFVSGVRRPELVRSGRNITMQIIGYMTSHRKQHLEATDVAREFGYGREHFCRLFRKATGKTFKEFLTDLRLDDTCRKLSGSSASIASIARECGFPDTRALQTAVQRKYGIRAQEYRERYENRN